jgi:hypothetical protein
VVAGGALTIAVAVGAVAPVIDMGATAVLLLATGTMAGLLAKEFAQAKSVVWGPAFVALAMLVTLAHVELPSVVAVGLGVLSADGAPRAALTPVPLLTAFR